MNRELQLGFANTSEASVFGFVPKNYGSKCRVDSRVCDVCHINKPPAEFVCNSQTCKVCSKKKVRSDD